MAQQPHILILMPDQQRADTLGCAGHPQVRTPHIDRLAGEGMRFEQCVTVSPVCMSARASFVSGLYSHSHGMWGNTEACLPAGDETYFHHLQRAGYRTAYVGKSHFYPHRAGHMREHEDYMHARGIDIVHETTGPLATQRTRSFVTDIWEKHGLYEAYRKDYAERGRRRREDPFLVRPSPLDEDLFLDSLVGRQACEVVEQLEDDRPSCLFVGFPGPHEPWDAPGRYADMYDPQDTPPAIPWPEANRDLPQDVRDMRDLQRHPAADADRIRNIRANYYGKISLLDDWIGRILAAYDKRGRLDNLLVVYWSDHGEMLGDHGRVYKETFHESSVRVPLILRWPGVVPGGTTSDALAEIVDVFPTLLEAAGCEASGRCIGRSLLPVARGDETALRPAQLSELGGRAAQRFMVRTRQHKYAMRNDGRGFMLYDLQADPHEQSNLIGQPDATALETTMREHVLDRLVATQASL